MPASERGEIPQQIQYPIEHNPLEEVSNRAVLLPGQDIRKMGMFEEWIHHPSSREVLLRGNGILKDEFGFDLLEMANPTLKPETDEKKASDLRKTCHTQPAVFLQSVAIHNYNKAEKGRKGYRTIPKYYSGVSMGMGTAAMLAGFMDFETGVRFHAERGRIMQEYSDPTPTSMIALVNVSEDDVKDLLQDERNKSIDLCLINSDSLWIVGGPNNPDDPTSPMQSLKHQLKERKIRGIDVDTDRAMHGRYVRPARKKFDEMIDKIPFSNPVSIVVGSALGKPIFDGEGMKAELKAGFDHTVDNRKPLEFFDSVGVHTFSEVGNPKGNFGKVMEKVFNARNLQIAGAAATGIAAGLGIYEVATRFNHNHPDHPNNSTN